MKKRFLALTLATLIGATVFSGCALQQKEEVKAAQGILADKIVVGSTGAQQGAYAPIGKPYFDGMKAYFSKINDEGGVSGKKIELKVLEDEFKPEAGIANVQKLINDEKVFALVGLFGTPVIKATVPVAKEAGIPAVYFATGATAPKKAGENFFPVQPNYEYEGKLMSMYAKDYFKSEKLAVIYRSDDVGLDGLAGIEQGAKELGIENKIVLKVPMDAGSTDVTAQVAKVKESGADALICYTLSPELSVVMKEMEKVGLTNTPIIASYSNVADTFIKANKEAAPNVIKNLHGLGWVDITKPAVKGFTEGMAKYAPDAQVNAYAMSGWIAAETFVKGLQLAVKDKDINSLTWKDYITAMGNLNYTDGLVDVSYLNGSRDGATKMTLAKVEGDKWVNKTEYLSFKAK